MDLLHSAGNRLEKSGCPSRFDETKVNTHTTQKEYYMSTLSNLKLVVGKRHLTASPVVHRRNKLVAKLHEQIELCEAKKAGNSYAPKHLKTYTNKQTGERMTVEAVKRVKQWWFTADNNKVMLQIRYGSRILEIAKGKNSIQIDNGEQLIAVLNTVKTCTENGELDTQIEAASNAVRARFIK